jgi:tetratricopeptide (TPR) repeat protein
LLEFARRRAAKRPSGDYRGVLKVAGSLVKGWLIDDTRPDRRVRFNLVIDGHPRGTYTANLRRRFLINQGAEEDSHGFSILIRKPWITGKPQTLRIEDPSDPALRAELTARLGPAANAHFDEHVVSGQVAFGPGDRARRESRARRAEDETETDIRPAWANRSLLRQISALGDAELASLLLFIDRDIVLDRLKKHDKRGDWESASVFRRAFLGSAAEERLTAFARIAAKAHNHGLAARIAGAAAALHPQSADANYLAGAARSAQGEYDDALRYLRAADRIEPGRERTRREMALALQRQLRGEMSAERRKQARAELLVLLGELSETGDAPSRLKHRIAYAQTLFAAGRYDEAIAVSEKVLAIAPNEVKALTVKARALAARDRIEEARTLYERIVDIDPAHRATRVGLRLLEGLIAKTPVEPARAAPSLGHAVARTDSAASRAADWICAQSGVQAIAAHPELGPMLQSPVARRAGWIEARLSDGRKAEFWRRAALDGLRDSGLLTGLDDADALRRWRRFYAPRGPAAQAAGASPATVALIAPCSFEAGASADRFLEQIAEHHLRDGFEPVLVGVGAGPQPQTRGRNGLKRAFAGDSSAALRRILLVQGVTLVHAISGAGVSAAEALNFTNIPLVYGAHLPRARPETGKRSPDVDEEAFRREFLLVLTRAAAVYASSTSARRAIEETFGVRCAVIHAATGERH